MNLDERLDILRNSGTLSQKNYNDVIRVVEYFKNKRSIELTEENASAFITHLCMALERIYRGEKTGPLDRDVYQAACQERTFTEASVCCRDICEILPQLSEIEAEYIITHIGVMLMKIENTKEEKT